MDGCGDVMDVFGDKEHIYIYTYILWEDRWMLKFEFLPGKMDGC